MKYLLVILLCLAKPCIAQHWQAEVMEGISGYNGDLSYSNASFNTVGHSYAVNIKRTLANRFLLLRGGIAYGKVSGNDKNNRKTATNQRNLNFQTNILELSMGVEFNLFDPEEYIAYPYVFAGVGVFHFNPYTYDKDGYKIFLQPLGTEGQGLAAYPDRKMYSRIQFCIPFGAGWTWNINDKYSLGYELGGRLLFTDYLDDVSTTYANPQDLQAERGPKAVELANRYLVSPGNIEGKQRGNSSVKDWYYITGIKFIIKFGN